ncbi:MAG: MBL fold metallo-hydrolase [Dethiobacter sp.]|nr:MBL fold metallo-hydrolase [Dethiobacter sp.]
MFKASVQDDVHCLKMSRTIMGRPLRASCSFFVNGLVIDGGSPYFKEHLHRFYSTNKPTQAVFTHCHEDHAGNVDLFNKLGITPYLDSNALSYFSSTPRIPLYRRVVWGNPAAGRCQEIGELMETEKYTFKVIRTPGHSPDHLCLYEEKKGWLFTGDLYMGEKILYFYKSEDLVALKQSLAKLASLNFSTLFCSHRGSVAKGPESLARKLSYIEDMQGKALQMRKNGYDAQEITKRLLGKEDYLYVISYGEFSKTAFVRALIQESNTENNGKR